MSNGADVVTVNNGGSVDISCTSLGVPVPTIAWTFNGMKTPYRQTDSSTQPVIRRYGESTPGRVVSTLHIVNPSYPANDGVYVCTGSIHAGVQSSSALITLQILGKVTIILLVLP